MALLDPRVWLLAILLGLVGFIGGYLHGDKTGAARVRADWDAVAKHQAEAAMQAERQARAEEQRRVAALQGVVNDAESKLARARADAAAAAGAAQRLRERIAALSACRSSGDPAVAGTGPAAGPSGDLLADVQRRLDEAADGIARYADAAAVAGGACERAYGSLNGHLD